MLRCLPLFGAIEDARLTDFLGIGGELDFNSVSKHKYGNKQTI